MSLLLGNENACRPLQRSRGVLLGVRVSARNAALSMPSREPARCARCHIRPDVGRWVFSPTHTYTTNHSALKYCRMPGLRFSMKGSAALVVAVGTVVVLLILLPAYRFFFAISLAIAAIVTVILRLWHRLRPVRLDDAEDKRPLKLD